MYVVVRPHGPFCLAQTCEVVVVSRGKLESQNAIIAHIGLSNCPHTQTTFGTCPAATLLRMGKEQESSFEIQVLAVKENYHKADWLL